MLCHALRILALAVALSSPAHARQAETNAAGNDALATCLPGSPFERCLERLKAAGVVFTPPRAGPGRHEIAFGLRSPFELVQIVGDDGAGGRITTLRFQARLGTGRPRREVLKWLDTHLKPSRHANASGAIGCGQADLGGPAWFGSESERYPVQPEVQFTIDEFPTIRGSQGRSMEDVIVNTPSRIQHLCFRLPQRKDGTFAEAPLALLAAEFIRSGPAMSRPRIYAFAR